MIKSICTSLKNFFCCPYKIQSQYFTLKYGFIIKIYDTDLYKIEYR